MLIESELFGHERGAYTSACSASLGLVADAEHGTLFLDEVEAMSQHAQVTLLRFLQDRVYRPVGSRHTISADVRIIAASNASLTQLTREGRFREDLLFRLRVMTVDMPPLRMRDGDIPLLVGYFVKRLAKQYACDAKMVSSETMDALCKHSWPGNVRELENLLHRAFLFSEGPDLVFDLAELRPELRGFPAFQPVLYESKAFREAKALAIEQFERAYVSRALYDCGGNVSAAARKIGKERRAFGKLMKKYGIEARYLPGHDLAPS
jgi:DNA-binding NtrC family response regulator